MLQHSKPLPVPLFVFGPAAAAQARVVPVPTILTGWPHPAAEYFAGAATSSRVFQHLIGGTIDGTIPVKRQGETGTHLETRDYDD